VKKFIVAYIKITITRSVMALHECVKRKVLIPFPKLSDCEEMIWTINRMPFLSQTRQITL